MVKYTQRNCQLLPTNCLSVFDHFVGLTLKGLTHLWPTLLSHKNQSINWMASLWWKYIVHNTSIKSIFGITNLICFRDIWKMHLLSSEKISFSMAICRKCLEHSVVFPVDLFWSNLHLMFPPIPFSWNSRVWSFFSSILGIETFFWKVLKFFFVVLMKDKSSHIKNRKAWW